MCLINSSCGFVVAGRKELISDLSTLVRSFCFNLIFSFHSVWLLRKFVEGKGYGSMKIYFK
jgi:hypothetical protein